MIAFSSSFAGCREKCIKRLLPRRQRQQVGVISLKNIRNTHSSTSDFSKYFSRSFSNYLHHFPHFFGCSILVTFLKGREATHLCLPNICKFTFYTKVFYNNYWPAPRVVSTTPTILHTPGSEEGKLPSWLYMHIYIYDLSASTTTQRVKYSNCLAGQ